MNRVLRKRLGRELKTNFARYLALVLLIVMGMYIIVSVVASADTIIDGTAEHGKQNKVEDGQFGVFIPLTDEQEKEITDKGITLEQHFSIDVTAKDGSKLRVFRKRNDIDLIELDSGRLAEKKGEAVVEKRYSEEHSLSVGDKLTAGGVEFEIVGIGTTPDYDTPFENFSDTAVSSKGFGLLFVSDDRSFSFTFPTRKAQCADLSVSLRALKSFSLKLARPKRLCSTLISVHLHTTSLIYTIGLLNMVSLLSRQALLQEISDFRLLFMYLPIQNSQCISP